MLHGAMKLAGFDDEVLAAIEGEAKRQDEHLELIASENYASPRVLEAQGSVLTNKYAEGYPGKRYYGGCEYADVIENLARERAKRLFKAGYANVQPHSGSQANAAVYMALMKPGDVFLGMNLADGGHLTHGAGISFSGRLYQAVQYGLDYESGEIDYRNLETLAKRHKPKMIMAGFSAYSRIIDWQRMRDIADLVGAYLVADMAHVAGLVAAGVYPSPVNIAHVTTSTTHKTLGGPRGGFILSPGDDEALCRRLDFAVFPESQGGPLVHVIAAKAVCFKEAMSEEFRDYQQRVVGNARKLAEIFLKRGFNVVSGGTDNHLLLLSLMDREITGQEAEQALGKANITVNKNAVPNDSRPGRITSGIRIGTPAITRRGMGEKEAAQLAHWICDILEDMDNQALVDSIRAQVLELCASFPVYS